MSQFILIFVMNIKLVTTIEVFHPEEIDYCAGWYHASDDRILLSCKMMDESIADFSVAFQAEEA